MPSVLITTEVLRDAPGPHVERLRAGGYDVRFPAKSLLLTEDDVLEAAQGFVAIIAGSEPYSDRVLAGLPALALYRATVWATIRSTCRRQPGEASP